MDSAIPKHLRCPRTVEPRAAEDRQPPYPAWVARLDPSVEQVVMGYFGVQFKGDAHAAVAAETVSRLLRHFAGDGGPGHHDLASYVDEQGFETLVAVAYWDDPATFRRWAAAPSLSAWWNDPSRCLDGVGHFREVLLPRIRHFETLFSTPDRFEGVATLAEAPSGEIREHGYWGSVRDRLPLAQTDTLQAEGPPPRAVPMPGRRVKVTPQEHLVLIRSGQEWTETSGAERELYLEEVEPALRRGMEFLRDHGHSIGCYANRYMRLLDGTRRPLDKSFGMSFWKSLEHLEHWAESHPTHMAIFGTFMKLVQAMNADLKLRLSQEVVVAARDEQFFEYLNCHPRTGMLRAASEPA